LLISVLYSGLPINPGIDAPGAIISEVENNSAEKPVMADTKDSKALVVCSGSALCATDRIVRIVDGDTLYTQNHHIRLSLTNTPERQEPGFSDATLFTSSLCPIGATITIDQDDKQKTDAYGRMLAKVTCSGKVLNAELLYYGHGVISQQYCDKSEFASESWATRFGC